MSEPIIQFISADELRQLAEADKAERHSRSTAGMLDDMDDALKFIDESMAKQNMPGLMVQWALGNPGDFFKLKARLLGATKNVNNNLRIQIGLPITDLDRLPEPGVGGE